MAKTQTQTVTNKPKIENIKAITVPYFRVLVKGEIWVKSGGKRDIQNFAETVNVSEAKVKLQESFEGYVIGIALPKVFSIAKSNEYPSYDGIRTWHIESIEEYNGANLGGEGSNFNIKSREELKRYIKVVGIPINAEMIKKDSDLRELLRVYTEERHRFDELYKQKLDNQREEEEFLELNNLSQNSSSSTDGDEELDFPGSGNDKEFLI